MGVSEAGMKKVIEVVDFSTDTIHIGKGLCETIIEIETDHGSCTETRTFCIDSCEGLIIKKVMDGRIILGVQDEKVD
jgi:hypothetical protein